MLIISLKQLQRNNQHQAQQSWRKKKNSTEIFKVFLCLRGPNFVKNLEFKKNLRTTQRKMRFESAFQVSKKFQNNSRSSRNSGTIDHHVVQNQILATKTQKKRKIEELGDINTSHQITSKWENLEGL